MKETNADREFLDLLGRTLKVLRTTKGLKQTTFAKPTQVSANYVSLVEAGRRQPSLTFLRRAARIYQVSLYELFGKSMDTVRFIKDAHSKTAALDTE